MVRKRIPAQRRDPPYHKIRPNLAVASLPPGIEPFLFFSYLVSDHSELVTRSRTDGEWKSNQYAITMDSNHLCEHRCFISIDVSQNTTILRTSQPTPRIFFEIKPAELLLAWSPRSEGWRNSRAASRARAGHPRDPPRRARAACSRERIVASPRLKMSNSCLPPAVPVTFVPWPWPQGGDW
jgi:hypothetical protein